MSWSRSWAVARHEFRVLRVDAASLASLIVMPLVMIAFLKPLARLALTQENPEANGAEFTVPAMATMFAFFLVGMIGFSFLTDRQLGTWERLRASQATSAELLIGKVIPSFTLAAIQQSTLFGLGMLLFDLRPEGSVLALACVVTAFCVCLTGLGVLIASLFKSSQQLNAFSNIFAMLLSGISGAFVPISLLPSWARTVAPISPQYWALRGYRAVILDGGSFGAIALPVGVLLGVALVAGILGTMRFSFDEPSVRVARDDATAAAAAAA